MKFKQKPLSLENHPIINTSGISPAGDMLSMFFPLFKKFSLRVLKFAEFIAFMSKNHYLCL